MIYLIRHGLDDETFVGGWSKNGLIPEGRKQVEEAIAYLKKANLKIKKIISSDIVRASETAIMISEALNLPVEYSSFLRELDKGKFTGIEKAIIDNEYPGYLDNVEIDTVYPDGESQITFTKRIQDNLDAILSEEDVLLVTHRGVINEIYRLYNEDEMSMDKKRYNVTHGSIHALDKNIKSIKRVDLEGKKKMGIVGKIVLTGGPCAGKTTALAQIEKNLTEQGYKVFVVSESATELIKGGVRPFGDMAIDSTLFQSLILDYQLAKEKVYDKAANALDEKSVIIYDRGIMDNKAYIDHKTFSELLKEKGLSELSLLDGYDMVIHLVTAADGKIEHYTLANNEARSESPEEAIELDQKTANAWVGHNNLKIIDNSSEFDEKLFRVINEVNNLINPTKRVRQQKKYIVNIDASDLEQLNDDNSTKISISQTYIEASNGIYEKRIRERRNGSDITHFMTVQKKKENGVSDILLDKKITEKEYDTLLSSSDDIRVINKTRISFAYKKNVFRLDIFENGLAILEMDVTYGGKEVALPSYIDVIEDVSDKEAFRNYVLASPKAELLKHLVS